MLEHSELFFFSKYQKDHFFCSSEDYILQLPLILFVLILNCVFFSFIQLPSFCWEGICGRKSIDFYLQCHLKKICMGLLMSDVKPKR